MLSHQNVALHTPVAPGSNWGTQETNSQPRVRVTPTNATPKQTPLSQHKNERGPMSPVRDLIRIHQRDRRTPQGIRDTNPPHDPPLSACTKARIQKHYRADRTVPTREAPGRAPGSVHHPSHNSCNPTQCWTPGTPKKNPVHDNTYFGPPVSPPLAPEGYEAPLAASLTTNPVQSITRGLIKDIVPAVPE